MRLLVLTGITMVAFAANSLLNRAALETGAAGPASFAMVRLLAGALVLGVLVAGRRASAAPAWRWPGWRGPAALALYVLGFSFAYVSLGAGVGALILFGGVQVTMFAGAVIGGEPVPWRRWAGALLSLAGLFWLLWPGQSVTMPLAGAGLMLVAAIGWGLYSLIGRGADDPMQATAANFLYAAPAGLAVWLIWPDAADAAGLMLAVLSGAVTSGLGYALWYHVLPGLGAARAAVAQLSVPVIALGGGVLFLGERVTGQIVLASALVLGGVALAIYAPSSARSASTAATRRSSGS